jgi:hypothetical protein
VAIKQEIKNLYRARKEFCEEFGKWPMFYSVRYFLTKLAEIDKALFELGEPPHLMTENLMYKSPYKGYENRILNN